MGCRELCLGILAIILPPLAVLFARGCGCDFLINIGLTMLGFIPGLIHACYVIITTPEEPQTVIVVTHQTV